ncbi:NahK/ErcS family hybrid sensor histidine kinase/response regulator [Neptunomonas antarctica]|uniref:histidine kinase n=1 Tax=Neptunomonas antarctica TaxID=619304 RepID=A0A1N7IVH7_9GAMM|nr:NahK/ErcS family hybrid sensor histidine kinase/response regulator [Neptunomonas antarctica]SIS41088.1 PAS domain S-box-containing protein [Neptunomonas antarctica]
MKKRSERNNATFEDLIGLGNHSARKNYYPELTQKLDELEAERNRYKWLFDNALHGIFQADLSGRFRTVNPAMAALCGYSSANHLVEQITAIDQQLFVDAQAYKTLLMLLSRDGKVHRYETRLFKADGNAIFVSMNALLKRDADDVTLEVFVQDISERKNDQARLKKLNEELEQRVEERTHALATVNSKLWDEIREREVAQQQLQVAKEQAEDANVSKDKYLAAASHDLLQPMNAARLLVSTLRERELAAADNHLVERIHVALEGAEDLLTDLLDISKLDQNAVQSDPCAFHLSQLLNAVQTEFQPVAESAGLVLRIRKTDQVVFSDAHLLMRVLRNFVSNALRYTNTGGVLVGCRLRGQQLEIQVWDSGEGIPHGCIVDIFKEFNQLEQHRNGMRTGVGLGLAIVERIARVLDHPIGVHSRSDRGSVFSIKVPLADADVSLPMPVGQVSGNNQFDGEAILVVDNDQDILISMQALLTQWGLKVYIAIDAEEAIALCQQGQIVPRVLLLDYHLNDGKTGLDARQSLDQYFNYQIPAALLTAERADHSLKQFRAQGLQVLNKPMKPGKLRALLTHILSLRT